MSGDLEASIRQAARMSGLLFSPHPEAEGWKTTRAVSPEVVAFTREGDRGRLGIRFYAEGETDEDGYTWGSDAWVLDLPDLGERDVYRDRGAAVEAAADAMRGRSP